MTRYLKRNTLIMITLLLFVILLSGCGDKSENSNDNNLEVYGGDLLRYSMCIEENKSQILSCPIIVNKSIENISFNNFVSDEKDVLSVTADSIDMNECVEYKGFYIYFVILNIECKRYDEAVNANIDKLLFEIDGEIVEYATPYFNVKNTIYYCENEDCLIEDKAIFISGDHTGIYGYIPDDERKLDLTIAGDRDIKIKSYRLADYLDVENLEIEGYSVDSDKIDIEAKKDEDIRFEYTLNFNENVSEDSIIRTSQIVIYEYENQDYLWVYTSGVYIWKDYTDYSNIKRYIDNL